MLAQMADLVVLGFSFLRNFKANVWLTVAFVMIKHLYYDRKTVLESESIRYW